MRVHIPENAAVAAARAAVPTASTWSARARRREEGARPARAPQLGALRAVERGARAELVLDDQQRAVVNDERAARGGGGERPSAQHVQLVLAAHELLGAHLAEPSALELLSVRVQRAVDVGAVQPRVHHLVHELVVRAVRRERDAALRDVKVAANGVQRRQLRDCRGGRRRRVVGRAGAAERRIEHQPVAAAEDSADAPAERRVSERGRGAIGGGQMRGRRRRRRHNFEHLRWLRSEGGDAGGGALCAQRGQPVGSPELAAALRKHVAQRRGPVGAAAVAQRREERLHFSADQAFTAPRSR